MTRYDKLTLSQRLARDSRRNISARAVWQGYKSRTPVWLELLARLPGFIFAHLRGWWRDHLVGLRKARRSHGWNE